MALRVVKSNPSGRAINWQPAHWEYSIPRAAAFWSVEKGAIICTGAEKTPSFSNAGTPSVGTVTESGCFVWLAPRTPAEPLVKGVSAHTRSTVTFVAWKFGG